MNALRRSEHSDSIDAIRGVAILLVVSFHWFGVPLGWSGVDLFFVLSGYLIGGLLIDNREAAEFFRPFYARRICRIIPLYLIFLSVTVFTTGINLPLWRYLAFSQNFAWIHTGLLSAGPTGLTWSLAVEEQFYLILPIIIRIFPNQGLMIISSSLIVLAPICRYFLVITVGMVSPYLLLPGRMDALFAGVLAACVVRHPAIWKTVINHKKLLPILAGGAFAGFLVLGVVKGFQPAALPMYLVGYSLLTVAYGCGLLAVIAYKRQHVKYQLLSAVGVGAYSIYLCHEAVLSETLSVVGLVGGGFIALFCAIVVVAVISIGCCVLIEKPLMRYARIRWRYGRFSSSARDKSTETPNARVENTFLGHLPELD